ncbi:carboxymethylenebutenolidase homolog isoform X1 [Ambystoma mexicanum]|uniref:carboxymethylenebutenolidase homolog isoform X1 n=1 Tax=Ambystoma mexicanum TaxID=8296 RepID=UPI0037E86C2C
MANEECPCPCNIGDKLEYGGLGQEVQIEHIKAYICKPPVETDRAVIVVQDIFGWTLPNTRYIVDMLAANGYIAVLPDYFVGGKPWDPSNDWALFDEWIRSRRATETDKETNVTVKYLKEQCNAKKIGVVGFCWGGVVVHHLTLTNPEIKAAVSMYGIISMSDDRYALKNPTMFIFAENDTVIPLEQVTVLEHNLKEKCKVDYEVQVYPGQTHGFVHRKREDVKPEDKACIVDARKRMINWLNKYI